MIQEGLVWGDVLEVGVRAFVLVALQVAAEQR